MKRTFFLIFLGICSFLSATGWEKRVYLASYPRAGNHWVRYLIEEVTGMTTSSVYCDGQGREYHKQHLATLFPWGYCPPNGFEGNRRYPGPDDIVILKTHYPVVEAQPLDMNPSLRSICIVRHPIDVFVSHHCSNQSHGKMPQQVMDLFITQFQAFHNYWEAKQDTIVFRYEDLCAQPMAVLKKILTAAGIRAKNQDIRRAITRYKPQGGVLKHLHQLDPSDVQIIKQRLSDYMQRYNYTAP